jgi:hypothetical protein
MRPNFQDLTNQVFGNLTVAWPAGRYARATVWLCFCSCGRTTLTKTGDLNSGDISRCTICFRIKHGACGSKEYDAFCGAKARCENPKHAAWKDYGGRGILFLFDNFPDFLNELGPAPTRTHSIDRINNDGHYERGNVKWATAKEQANNRKRKCQIY